MLAAIAARQHKNSKVTKSPRVTKVFPATTESLRATKVSKVTTESPRVTNVLKVSRPSMAELCGGFEVDHYKKQIFKNSTTTVDDDIKNSIYGEVKYTVGKQLEVSKDPAGKDFKNSPPTLKRNRPGILMHRRDPIPIYCLSFIRGHYRMAWRQRDR